VSLISAFVATRLTNNNRATQRGNALDKVMMSVGGSCAQHCIECASVLQLLVGFLKTSSVCTDYLLYGKNYHVRRRLIYMSLQMCKSL